MVFVLSETGGFDRLIAFVPIPHALSKLTLGLAVVDEVTNPQWLTI